MEYCRQDTACHPHSLWYGVIVKWRYPKIPFCDFTFALTHTTSSNAIGLGMLGAILQKRRKMSNKDALLEQAAMSAAGLQQAHVLGIVILVVLVIAVFALLGLKNITWALLLIMNTALFGYLLKLTVDSGVSTGETIIGPDGTIIHAKDSDDESSVASDPNPNNGTYTLPTLT